MNNLEKLRELIRKGIGSTLPQHQAARLAEQIAQHLHNEGVWISKNRRSFYEN